MRAPALTVVRNEELAESIDISEDGLAKLFADKFAMRLAYCEGMKKWFHWGSHLFWRVEQTLLVFDFARAVCRDTATKTTVNKQEYLALKKASTVAAVVRMASYDRRLAVSPDRFDSDPMKLNTKGGVVSLTDGTVRVGQPSDFCTMLAPCTPEGDCPRWLQFLYEVFGGDVEMIEYAQRALGYTATGLVTEHSIFVGVGSGGNGKSVFLRTIGDVLGTYSAVAPENLFTESKLDRHPTELAMLRGIRFLSASETEEGKNWNEARVKAVTGGDPITARTMRADFSTFLPQFKPWIGTNHKPRIRNAGHAMARRLHLLPFNQRFDNPDRDLPAKLRAELGGILRWMIEGCQMWQRVGLMPPKRVVAATEDYMTGEDSIGAWLVERCELETNAFASNAELFTSWAIWAKSRGEFVGTQRRLIDQLESKGFEKGKNSAGTQRGLRGLRVVSDSSDSSDSPSHWGRYTREHHAHTRRLQSEDVSDLSETSELELEGAR